MNSNSGNELVVLASTLSIFISEIADPDQLDVLSNIFNAIGDNLAVIASTQGK
jgi:hypothetical protein